jgi:L-alanine-DL-glutamate epimerase-like enolase superfamily enzyme
MTEKEINVIDSSHQGWNRRRFVKLAIMLPISAGLAHFRLLAQTQAKKVKITGIRAMALNNIAGNCLIRIDTDSGLTGYGEAGATGPIARARIETIKPLLIGKDPLQIEVHFQAMSSMMYNYMAHIPTVSGIDIALWDLAGKILGRSVSEFARRWFSERDFDVFPWYRGRPAGQGILSRVGATHSEHV